MKRTTMISILCAAISCCFGLSAYCRGKEVVDAMVISILWYILIYTIALLWHVCEVYLDEREK